MNRRFAGGRIEERSLVPLFARGRFARTRLPGAPPYRGGSDLFLHDAASARYSVIGFSEVDNSLIEALHETRDQPYCSVIALASSPSLMENGTTWRVLHACAADVVVWDGPAAAPPGSRVRALRIAAPTSRSR